MTGTYTPHRAVLSAAFALAGSVPASAAFTLDYSASPADASVFSHAIGAHTTRGMLLLACFAISFGAVLLTPIREHIRWNWPVALLLGSGWAVGRQFAEDYPFSGNGQELKLAIAITGFTIFFWFLHQLLCWLIRAPWAPRPHRLPCLRSFLARESFLLTFLFLLAMWIVPLWLHYPAGLYFDVNNELEQGFGLRPYTTGHPLAHILLLTAATKMGMLVARPDFGIFILEVFMVLVLALAVAYAVRFLTRRQAPWWSYVLILAFYGVSPWIIGTLGDPTKDIHYSTFVFIFVVFLAEIATEPEEFLDSRWRQAVFVLTVTCVVLFRNNGFHVALITVIAMAAFFLARLKRRAAIAAIPLVAALAVPVAVNTALSAWLHPEPFRAGEALALPLQQAARVVRDHPEAITATDEQVLRKVLPFDAIAELYDPYTVDRLKDTVRYDDAKEFERGAEAEFLMTWLSLIPRAPLTCLDATWQQNLFLSYPETTIHRYYIHSSNEWETKTYLRQFFLDPPSLVDTKEKFIDYLDDAHTLPVLRNLNSLALYTMSVPVLWMLALHGRKRSLLLPLLPVFLSVLVIIAAPGLQNFPRYAYPVIFTIPFLWAIFAAELRTPEK